MNVGVRWNVNWQGKMKVFAKLPQRHNIHHKHADDPQDKTFKFYGLLPESNVIDIASSQHGNKFHEVCVCVCGGGRRKWALSSLTGNESSLACSYK